MRTAGYKISGEHPAIGGSDAIPTHRSSSLPVAELLSVKRRLPAKDKETRRSLCSYILYAGRRNSDHDREDQGNRENHAIREMVTLWRRYGEG